MSTRGRFPLMAKMLGWLFLHMVILALAFFGFVSWQLGLGLDSLLSGSAGERLRAFGDEAREQVLGRPRPEWDGAIRQMAATKGVHAAFFDPGNPARNYPDNVIQRARTEMPPRPRPPGAGRPGPPRPGPGEGNLEGDAGNRSRVTLPASRPLFLLRGDGGDRYWAGVQLAVPGPPGRPLRHELLLIRADGLDGSGMFFDFKPWLWGGLAVLGLSLAFWTPFVWGITRYLRRLTAAAERISAGHFDISLPPRSNDELANLGGAIKAMAGRLDHLITGQKRFLGDAAHELCAPLARLRTGLAVLEMKAGDADLEGLADIEIEAAELATLIEEILAFSRAGGRSPRLQPVVIEPLIRDAAKREGLAKAIRLEIPAGATAHADPALLFRAFGNLVRNVRIHAGEDANMSITGRELESALEITVTDDGPGVPHEELPHLFEPFYRPDRSRSRDTGGSGLGLAIVRTAVESCGGEAVASVPAVGGFSVTIRLRKNLKSRELL